MEADSGFNDRAAPQFADTVPRIGLTTFHDGFHLVGPPCFIGNYVGVNGLGLAAEVAHHHKRCLTETPGGDIREAGIVDVLVKYRRAV